MQVRIIKGTKQIGGCITEIICKNTKIIIDFGEDLEDNKKPFELEGLTKGKSSYDAVFITHSHGDHIGLIDKINEDIFVYVEEESLEIHNLTCDFCNKERVKRKINTFKIPYNLKKGEENRVIFDNGDLKVSVYSSDHSSYNSCMFLIEGDGKRILHTGDFRTHGRRKEFFKISLNKIGKVDMLITEGTTLTRFKKTKEKFMSEEELEKKAYDIIKKYDQVFILQSSTNIDRTVSFARAALANNKKFVLDLFSYYINENTAHYFNVDFKNVFVWKPMKYKYKPNWFKDKYLSIDTSSNIFPNFVMEIKESMLPDIKMLHSKGLLKNACFIYSMWSGYKEKEENLKKFLDEMKKVGIAIKELHTSGHADLDGMKMVNDKLDPDYTVIIHTENSNLGKKIFNNVISVKDGEIMDLNIRTRYENSKDFFIRIREDEDIVYYRGIKAFKINNFQYNIEDNIFKLNETNISKAIKINQEKNEKIDIVKATYQLRKEISNYFSFKMKSISFELSTSQKVIDESLNFKKIKENIKELLKDYIISDNLDEELAKIDSLTKSGNTCTIKMNGVEGEKAVQLEYDIIKSTVYENDSYSKKTGFKIPKINYDIKVNNNPTSSLDAFEDAIKKSIDHYIINTKMEIEKTYQQQFMLDEKIKNSKGITEFKDSYSFEEEYYVDKGRIDSVFIKCDDNKLKEVYFIELKVNEGVLAGSNGLHKHFIDIRNSFKKREHKKEILNELVDFVDYRLKSLSMASIKENTNIDDIKIYYYTFIGYYHDDKNLYPVRNIYNVLNDFVQSNLTRYQTEYKKMVEKPNSEMFTKSLTTHIEELESLGITVKIFLDDWDNQEISSSNFVPIYDGNGMNLDNVKSLIESDK